MVAGWVPVFDQSFTRVPVTRLHEMYEAGYRVMAGYRGGGTSDKWLTAKEIAAWFALGDDTGIAALFEIRGTEPIDNPASGISHALDARAAWRFMGYPDDCSISPAVDRNVTVTEARVQLTRYFRNWTVTDTALPIPYVEMDAGIILVTEGISAGTFTPAAYSWDSSNKLVVPSNAPEHVVWTQEHNGRNLAGGNVDIGHIRTTANIQWKGTPEMNLSDKLSNGHTVEQALLGAFYAATPASVWHSDQFTPKLDADGKPVVPTVYTETASARMDRLNKMAAYIDSSQFIIDIVAAATGGGTPNAIASAVVAKIRLVQATE
jgi:hypothetical protein